VNQSQKAELHLAKSPDTIITNADPYKKRKDGAAEFVVVQR